MVHLGIGIAFAILFGICLMGRASSVATAILSMFAGAVWAVLSYCFLPTLAWGFGGILMMLFVNSLAGTIVGSIVGERISSIGVLKTLIIAVIALGVPFFSSSPMFNSGEYRELLGPVKDSTFDKDVAPVDIGEVRTVDQDLAKRLGEKRLGEDAGLGSRVELGTMNIQVINGTFTVRDQNGQLTHVSFHNELVWAGPLNHKSFWKQNSNDSTPGFILVSATDQSKVYMVTTDSEGNPLKLHYLLSGGYFSKYLPRHLYNNGYMSVGLDDFSFEIGDDGRPYWVVTKYAKRVGFSGDDATGVVVVDAQTGAIKDYSIADAPSWIDRIQPESFITEQLNDWGVYVHGYWNTWFAGQDILKTTPGMSLVYGSDGRSYWYTGITSAGSDQGTVGFVLVDTRTKQVFWYKVAGANEAAAAASAANAPGVKEAGYAPTNPILYNVAGQPTYFTTLKGNDGLPKMFAFISVTDYTVVGTGSSPAQALRNYQIELGRKKGVSADGLVDRKVIEATVADITSEVVDGNTFYYLRLQGFAGKEFFATSQGQLVELKWTKVGDSVRLIFDEGESRSVNILAFDNPALDLVKLNNEAALRSNAE
ncbi:MAG: hypothetical protein GC134_06670 [Proteobacteria bacterium]|nr:hypothetical protein [Pseudomonadota bacterium]